ncbi:hypothetical protein ACIBI4_06205 [Streptomyces sp. NPDC050418]|uniref:hypothetical protein n=1 Tax=Streptomyces sp. NPDC050418 TaxID=3365612 RepID=UPI0037930CC7
MRISDEDDINHSELIQILGTSFVAMIRGGRFTSKQKKKIERITAAARKREDARRNGR